MKTKQFISATIIALMLFGTSPLFAQHGSMFHNNDRVKFTEEQKAKIKEIHLASFKEMQVLKNQMGELKAKQHTLSTTDKPDLNAINANIDEISKIQGKMMKIKAADNQKIRGLLSDEQKMQFDSGMMHKKGRMKMHRGEFNGNAEHQERS